MNSSSSGTNISCHGADTNTHTSSAKSDSELSSSSLRTANRSTQHAANSTFSNGALTIKNMSVKSVSDELTIYEINSAVVHHANQDIELIRNSVSAPFTPLKSINSAPGCVSNPMLNSGRTTTQSYNRRSSTSCFADSSSVRCNSNMACLGKPVQLEGTKIDSTVEVTNTTKQDLCTYSKDYLQVGELVIIPSKPELTITVSKKEIPKDNENSSLSPTCKLTGIRLGKSDHILQGEADKPSIFTSENELNKPVDASTISSNVENRVLGLGVRTKRRKRIFPSDPLKIMYRTRTVTKAHQAKQNDKGM